MAMSSKTRKLAISGMLSAILIILGLTPIGFIPIGPANATIMQLPVIIGAIVEGPIVGLVLGVVFGALSLLRAVTAPSLLSPIFLENWFFVTMLPRILIGPAAYYIYTGVERLFRNKKPVSIGIAAALGTLVNTAGVLGMMFLMNGQDFADLMGISLAAVGATIMGIALTNGIAEIIISILITVPVVMVIQRIKLPSRRGEPIQ